MTEVADVCIVVEGCYPFVAGGVSSWLDWLIRMQPGVRFSVVAITADENPGEPKYDFPENVIQFNMLPLMPKASRPRFGKPCISPSVYADLLVALWENGDVEALDRLGDLALQTVPRSIAGIKVNSQPLDHADFVSSAVAWDTIVDCANRLAPEASFSDVFWAWRSLVGGLMSVLRASVPEARVYHAISTGYAGLYAARAASKTGGRMVVTEHGIYTNERRIDLLQANWLNNYVQRGFDLDDRRREVRDLWILMFESYARITYKLADKVTTLYGANQSFQTALGAREETLVVIPNGIALEKFDALPATVPGNPPTVGLIGRVVPIKDIETMIRAAGETRNQIPDVRFLVIGPTDENPEYYRLCKSRVEELGLADTVVFTGRMNIPDILPELDVMLLTSVSEAQPLVLLEAGAARIPCVATDVGSCREIIEGAQNEAPNLGRGGRIVPPMDPTAVARATVELLRNDEERARCGRNLRARVETYFSSESSAARYAALYEELVA